jgi:hypothetical protein
LLLKILEIFLNCFRHIKISKGPFALGLVIDANVDKAINGCVVKNICSKKAVARDGRIQVPTFISA